MQISALTDIVEGTLLNSPSISFITQIHTNVKKVNDGDAFFAKNVDDIEKAKQNGAFAIITDFMPEIDDQEIAWIKVESLNKSITNILRYNLLKYTIEFIYVDKVMYNLLQLFKTREMSNILLLSDDIYNDFETINNIESSMMVFSTHEELLEKISPNVINFKIKEYEVKNLTVNSLFETSFSYKEKYFDKVKIPSLYLNHLLSLMELFDYKLDLRKLSSLELFSPIFINKSNQIVPFGQTNRFIIANKDEDISRMEINYLNEAYSYGKITVLDGSILSCEDIFENTKAQSYNALYIKGQDKTAIIEILEKNYFVDKLFN
jgi:ferrochelatase